MAALPPSENRENLRDWDALVPVCSNKRDVPPGKPVASETPQTRSYASIGQSLGVLRDPPDVVELELVQPLIQPAGSEHLVVRAHVEDPPGLHYHDPVGQGDGP
jgi:hypothetical protein